MMKKNQHSPIVITSIFPPNKVIFAYVKKNFSLVIAGDRKTQEPWEFKNCEYLSTKQQESLFPELGAVIPYNHYARKNFAYLKAVSSGVEQIFETDDDNFPQKHFPNFLTKKEIEVQVVSSSNNFFNTYQDFLKGKETLWARGYPLKRILDKSQKVKRKKQKIKSFIQQSLIDNDTDVDAIYRLTINKMVTFKKNKKLALSPHTYSPINSQNTAWYKEAFLFLYLPSTVSSRVCDILRGWIAQRLQWEIGGYLLFLSPSVYQMRNEHDFLKDFKEEIPLYLETENTIRILEDTILSGSIENKLLQIYKALVKNSIVLPEEIERVKAWIKTLEKSLR